MSKLKFGQTPWDDMPRKQLLREVQRMYSALISARSVLGLMRHGNEKSLFWKNNTPDARGIGGGWGSGGAALAKAEQALAPYPNEPAYDSFFRYANDLLFESVGSNWTICKHGHMSGSLSGEVHQTCQICLHTKRGVVPMRPITWNDLRPQ